MNSWLLLAAIAVAVFFAFKYFKTPEGKGDLADLQRLINEHRENQRKAALQGELLEALGAKPKVETDEIAAVLNEHQTAEQRKEARVKLLKALGYDPSEE